MLSSVVSRYRLLCFFFCKQKTAYEMRISDRSSDVCSSDLLLPVDLALEQVGDARGRRTFRELPRRHRKPALGAAGDQRVARQPGAGGVVAAAQIDQDGVAVGEGQPVILDHRHLPEGVAAEELRRDRKSTRLNSSH